jgi:hypothetical protein
MSSRSEDGSSEIERTAISLWFSVAAWFPLLEEKLRRGFACFPE